MLAAAAPSTGRADTVASLLGNFTINQFCGLRIAEETIDLHYVVIFGQLPALRELHAADADGDGVTTQAERDAYVGGLAPGLADGLELRVDGTPVPLRATRWTSSLPTEQGGFSLRLDVRFSAALPPDSSGLPRRLNFTNRNYADRMGWHEIVAEAADGQAIYDTNAFDSSLTGALSEAIQSLPQDGPLDERTVSMTFVRGDPPPGAVPIGPRAGASPVDRNTARGTAGLGEWIETATRRLVDSISGPRVAPQVLMLALLGALVLGAVHALSPGHGKTIVGAYLIGSRGTSRHALFLGLTVTVTHTFGVFLLGFATLYASRYIMPERLFPILSLLSAVLVLGMGIVLLVQRGRAARRSSSPARSAGQIEFYAMPAAAMRRKHSLILAGGIDTTMHSHGGGRMHSHLPPGAAGEKISLRGLLALGISGGLVPCPSALVLLLAAVALNKPGLGMLLVLAFSLGLAITLTVVGLLFLYARSRLRRPESTSRWPQVLPILSAALITVVGVALCVGALKSFPH